MSKFFARAASSSKARRSPIRGMLVTAAMFGGAVLLAITATGGTYAMWNSKTAVNASSVSAGATDFTINDVKNYTISGLDMTKMLPGRSVITWTPLVLKNTGTTPISITPGAVTWAAPSSSTDSSTFASSLTVVVKEAVVANGTTSCVVTPYGTAPASFTTPIKLTAGQTRPVCVEVRLSDNASSSVQGKTATFTLNLEGVQVRS